VLFVQALGEAQHQPGPFIGGVAKELRQRRRQALGEASPGR
jgi:hypothetical protein